MWFTDPVCGMGVHERLAPVTRFEGVTFYFCSMRCLDKFLDDPAHYAEKRAPELVELAA